MDSRFVPTWPLLGRLALVMAWAIEIMAWASRLATGGKLPLAHKFWIVTVITALATTYKLTYRRRHKVYDQPSPIATNLQSWLIVGLVVLCLAVNAWLYVDFSKT